MADKHVPQRAPHVIIFGGGLAGMAAACTLLENPEPLTVTLVEQRPYLGGRAFSFLDPQTHSQVDNGQHVFLGCCTYYIDFLRKLETFHMAHLQSNLRLNISDCYGTLSKITSVNLPAPFNILPSFLKYHHLTFKERLLVVYAIAKILATDRLSPNLEQTTFHSWLINNHQSDGAIKKFWNLIILPTLNDDVQHVSATMGLMIFQEGVLKSRRGSALGYSQVALSTLMGEAAQSYITKKGGHILLGKQVSQLSFDNDAMSGVEFQDGSFLKGDFYVSALPFKVLNTIIERNKLPTKAATFFQNTSKLTTSPIINIHLWYDRPIMDEPFMAFVNHAIQWIFNKSSMLTSSRSSKDSHATQQELPDRQHLCISISGAWEYIHQPKDILRQKFVGVMADVFPKAKAAKLLHSLVVKEKDATFRCLPGATLYRPSTRTPIDNLFLAGEWTDTGWPSTMEGAVRSGVSAAEAIASRRQL